MKTFELQGIRQEVSFTAVRSGGPGGQNVNKVSSAAVLSWDFKSSTFLNSDQKSILEEKLASYINKSGLITLRSDEHRDLIRNKERCLEKLFALLTKAFHRPKVRRPTKPTLGSKIRKRESKEKRGEVKKLRKKERY